MQKLVDLMAKNINKRVNINRFSVSSRRFNPRGYDSGYEFIVKEETDEFLQLYIQGYDIGWFKYGKLGNKPTKVTIMLAKSNNMNLDDKSIKILIENFGKKIFNYAFREALKKRFKQDKIC